MLVRVRLREEVWVVAAAFRPGIERKGEAFGDVAAAVIGDFNARV